MHLIGGSVAQGHHDREVMGNDVMHLARDPGALVGGRQLELVLVLALEALRALA